MLEKEDKKGEEEEKKEKEAEKEDDNICLRKEDKKEEEEEKEKNEKKEEEKKESKEWKSFIAPIFIEQSYSLVYLLLYFLCQCYYGGLWFMVVGARVEGGGG